MVGVVTVVGGCIGVAGGIAIVGVAGLIACVAVLGLSVVLLGLVLLQLFMCCWHCW